MLIEQERCLWPEEKRDIWSILDSGDFNSGWPQEKVHCPGKHWHGCLKRPQLGIKAAKMGPGLEEAAGVKGEVERGRVARKWREMESADSRASERPLWLAAADLGDDEFTPEASNEGWLPGNREGGERWKGERGSERVGGRGKEKDREEAQVIAALVGLRPYGPVMSGCSGEEERCLRMLWW